MIKIECPCGKKGTAPEKAAGGRVKCPACGQLVVVPCWEPAVPPAALPLAARAGRRAATRKLVIVGAVALSFALLGLMAFIGRAWLPRPASTAARPPPVKRAPPAPVAQPVWLEEKDMPGMADLYVRLVIAETLDGIAGIENPRILSCEVQRMEPDVRKIPELWMATATVAVSMKRDEANETPPAFSTMWRLLVQCTQSNHYAECWREVTDLRRGTVTRVHKETSEWIPQFRADVALDWGRAFQRDVRQVGSVSERDRQAALQSLKEFRAARYRVSVGELEEILEADDGMTLPVGKAFVPEPLPAARRGEDGRRDDRERSRVGGALAAPVAGRGRSRVGHEAKSQAPDVAKAVSRRQAAAAQAALAAEALSAKKYKKYHRADLVAKNHPAGTVSPKQVVAKAAKPTGTPLIEIGAEPLTQRDIDRGLGGPPGPPRR